MKLLSRIVIVSSIMLGGSALAADKKFESADRDGDGLLSMAELVLAMPSATPDAFNAADADDNGLLSEAEYIAAVNDGVLSEG